MGAARGARAVVPALVADPAGPGAVVGLARLRALRRRRARAARGDAARRLPHEAGALHVAVLAPLAARGRPCVVFEFASFPWGTAEGRTGPATRFGASPGFDRDEAFPGDSVSLDDWHAVFSKLRYVDARYVVLRRDPLAACWSHRDWDGSLARHAVVLAQFQRYVADFLRARRLCARCAKMPLEPLCGGCDVPDPNWCWLDYDDLCVAHAAGDWRGVLGRLANFVGVDSEDVEDALAYFRPSSKTPAVPPRLAATIDLGARHADGSGLYVDETHV